MSKTACACWNPLDGEQQHPWRWLQGLEGQVEEVIFSHDNATSEFTRLIPASTPGPTPAPSVPRCTMTPRRS